MENDFLEFEILVDAEALELMESEKIIDKKLAFPDNPFITFPALIKERSLIVLKSDLVKEGAKLLSMPDCFAVPNFLVDRNEFGGVIKLRLISFSLEAKQSF